MSMGLSLGWRSPGPVPAPQPHVDRCVAQRPGTSFEFPDFRLCEGRQRCPWMPTVSAGYEPFAWWLAREGIGRDLRERYAVSEELPPSLITLVKKLDSRTIGCPKNCHLARECFLANETPPKAVNRSVAPLSSQGHKLGQVYAEALQIRQG